MKKAILSAILVLTYVVLNAQNDDPYAIFGHRSYVNYKSSARDLLYVKNSDPCSDITALALDVENRRVLLLNKGDSTIKTYYIDANDLLTWVSTDPHADKYPSLSPYCYVGNMPIRAIDPDGKDIYILFASTGNSRGDAMLGASAYTRQRNIEQSSLFDPSRDKVVVLQFQDLAQIQGLVAQTIGAYSSQYGQTREVGIFSHGAMQGPTGSVPTSQNANAPGGKQMNPTGWSMINFNWVDNGGSFTMYGCNTGNDIDKSSGQWVGSFARTLSSLYNFNNVQVAGQSSYSFPSASPNCRETNLSRSYFPSLGYSVGDTYMVGGNKGQSSNSMWFSPLAPPAAIPMNVYMGGQKIGSGTQTTSSSNPLLY